MNAITSTQNLITCETTEEHSHPTSFTSVITSSPPVDNVSTMVQGVSGAVYAPMDTSPTPQQPRLDYLMAQLTATLTNIVEELTRAKSEQTDLIEAVDIALGNADWFRERIEDSITEAVDEKDFDYEIGNSVERYMRNEFDPNDHVDFNDLVNDRVDDLIDDIVSEKVEEAIESRLSELLEEKLKDANITINF